MKVTAFLMIVCMAFLMAFSGKVKAMDTISIKSCCHGAEKPCHPHQKDDCNKGMCTIILSCPICCFLAVDPIMVKPLIPISKELQTTPYHIGDLSDYSLINWNPPKV
jgi:hypothetical protein